MRKSPQITIDRMRIQQFSVRPTIRMLSVFGAKWAKQMLAISSIASIALLIALLAGCGATVQRQRIQARAPQVSPTPAPMLDPSPTPAPTVTPTPRPTAVPQPPAPAPLPTLDVRPASMSIVGHLDCTQKGAYICQAAVISPSSNQQGLRWSSSTSVPGRIALSPASGVLAPGQSVLVTITVPFGDCTPGLFAFHGPINTHTISWAC